MGIVCGCRCIVCKSNNLEGNRFVASDGYEDIHHTCRVCRTHFNHLDGETYATCKVCGYEQ